VVGSGAAIPSVAKRSRRQVWSGPPLGRRRTRPPATELHDAPTDEEALSRSHMLARVSTAGSSAPLPYLDYTA
jgi:hypothetical protein